MRLRFIRAHGYRTVRLVTALLVCAGGWTRGAAEEENVKRTDPSRFHGVVRWDAPARIEELRGQGLSVLEAGAGIAIVSGAREQAGLAEPLAAAAKISPVLVEQAGAGAVRFLAQFHGDISDATMRSIADRESLPVREHPDLLPGHLMLEGTLAAMESLARWDEVAYLWPASAELESGHPVRGCQGAITEFGPVGQYIARVGQGWDGAGQGAVELLYSIEKEPSRVANGLFVAEAAKALAEWSRWVKIDFKPGGLPSSPRHLNFRFAQGAHGDPYPFDGRGKTLAHTFYPAPPNPEPQAGDLHFDDEENWQVGSDTDIFSVVLHELGHALGLGHADRPGSVMYAYYTRVSALTADDIAAIRDLYASRGSGSEQPPPSNNPAGPATPQPPATTPPPSTPDRVAPSIVIAQPSQSTFITSADKITVSGTARDNVGVTLVIWWSNTAGTGPASGTTAWSAPNLPLARGTNYIKVTAFDASGNSSWRSVVVTRK